jgi:hypothetical protein
MILNSLLPSVSNKDFECNKDQPGKFRSEIIRLIFLQMIFFSLFSDPNVCNIFHVCITRNNKTVDQPFMCPYPTIFKGGLSGKMSCAYPEPNDCQSKAFYHSIENSTNLTGNLNIDNDDDDDKIDYRLPENTLIVERCLKEGIYADSTYCNAYHKCTRNGEDEQYLCENQLLFNPESKICDYPINVICGGENFEYFYLIIICSLFR